MNDMFDKRLPATLLPGFLGAGKPRARLKRPDVVAAGLE